MEYCGPCGNRLVAFIYGFVDDKLLVLCVVAIDPLQGNIYLSSWNERPLTTELRACRDCDGFMRPL